MGGPVRDITGHVVCALSQLNDGVAVSFAVLRAEDMEPQKRISRILNMEYFWRPWTRQLMMQVRIFVHSSFLSVGALSESYYSPSFTLYYIRCPPLS